MAGIAPGLDGFLMAQQQGQQRQMQQFGILSQLAQLRNSEEAAQQAREMRPLQLEMLRSQIAAQKAQAPLKALELQQKTQQIGAQGLLSELMLNGGYQGPTSAPTAVAQNDAEALRMVQEAEARGQPLGVNVPNPQNVRALGAVAYPQEFGKSLFPKPMAPTAPVKVPDASSPTGFRFVSREQALGMSAPPAGRDEGGTPYFQPVQTANGVYAFNARTGKMEPVQVNGAPVVGAVADPALQGAIAGAKVAGQATAKRDINMSGLGGVIQQADDLLSGIKRGADGIPQPANTPTESGIGTAVDATAGFFGASPTGSVEAQQLKALGGALTAKMPRMEGPQSDKDVQLYREMAAQIGDSTVPIARRKAALETVKSLWSKYETNNRRSTDGTPVRKFNPQTGRIE